MALICFQFLFIMSDVATNFCDQVFMFSFLWGKTVTPTLNFPRNIPIASQIGYTFTLQLGPL